ncbi:ABC transporter permease [Adhaeribacter pallidiroseus]|uniref:Putative ABC transporter permease YknZ n=1 Tax=Adhaeribacter pallidiroseus TaxID=2072847 RepID=A0A369QQR1_9BACT|nr:ABC transporter permease [Adhaeribacter pallidiroseus]RDC65567.1 putative ABC transporter permease YknZ [Adhaeribacter pallidiroseus]
MLQNYFKITLRNLFKNKTFSFINIAGLAVGMASFILITLWIHHELSFEQFHEKKATLYRVFTNVQEAGRVLTGNTTPAPLASSLHSSFPEIKSACRTSYITNHLFKVNAQEIAAAGLCTDPNFLQLFSFPLIKGDSIIALQDPQSVVLTEEFAIALFGKQDPIGQIVRLDNKENFKVTGVLKIIPQNSSFYFQYLLPYEYFRRQNPWGQDATSWDANPIHTYVELKPGASLAQVQEKLKNLPARHGEKDLQLFLHPLTDWYLYSNFENGKVAGGRIEIVRFFGIIAGLILVMACINFMNLSTVRSARRAREVGVRKVLGVTKKGLVFQFLGESIFLAFLAGMVALGLVFLALPTFNELMLANFAIDYQNFYFWVIFVLFLLFTGAAAGVYPAFYLSAFKPVYVLKGIFHKSQKAFPFHKLLVIVQFTFGIVLIISSLVIQKQIKHAQVRDTGYQKEMLIHVQYFGDLKKNYRLLKNDLLRSGVAASVTQTNSPITELWDNSAKVNWAGKTPGLLVNFNVLCADEDLVPTFGLKLTAGRDFDLKNFPTDSMGCMLNESAVKVMGFKDPIGQTIVTDDQKWKVVGIVKNFILGSPYTPTEPLVILGAKSWFNVVHIKFKNNQTITENLSKTEALVKKYNPAYPFAFSFVDEAYEQKFSDEKRVGKLVVLFTALTIFISCLGLFGLATYTAEQRTKEIGIRKVLGASLTNIVSLLSRDFLKLIVIANLIAWPLAGWVMHQWLQNYACRISLGWGVFALAGSGALILALLTVSFQAIKAAVANPVNSLRNE